VQQLPYSENTFDEAVAAVLRATKPCTVLDVGCGAGKYGRIVRSALDVRSLIGYEPEKSYVARFRLRKLYDEVRIKPIQEAIQAPSEHFDMCIFGDSLEHLPKSAGNDVVHFFLYRTSFVVVVAPLEYLQDNGERERFEAHLSSWSPLEFFPYTDVAYTSTGKAWLGLLRGFECSRAKFRSVVSTLRAHHLIFADSMTHKLSSASQRRQNRQL
jgi:SAM-dependent methyltransferase